MIVRLQHKGGAWEFTGELQHGGGGSGAALTGSGSLEPGLASSPGFGWGRAAGTAAVGGGDSVMAGDARRRRSGCAPRLMSGGRHAAGDTVGIRRPMPAAGGVDVSMLRDGQREADRCGRRWKEVVVGRGQCDAELGKPGSDRRTAGRAARRRYGGCELKECG
uniref:DUF834 domain-containing protein n=1 Tax=Oryza meridionalis TaxID=40149 RepID=A0A0E0DCY4_9ORYZ